MISDASPGARLKGYIEARWGKPKGGMEALAQAAGLRGRQTLYEWFAGAEPSLAALGQVAAALGVRRVDLVAVYDGVVAPETAKAPRPEWAEGLESGVADEVMQRLRGGDLEQLKKRVDELALALRPPAAGGQTEDERTRDIAAESAK